MPGIMICKKYISQSQNRDWINLTPCLASSVDIQDKSKGQEVEVVNGSVVSLTLMLETGIFAPTLFKLFFLIVLINNNQ